MYLARVSGMIKRTCLKRHAFEILAANEDYDKKMRETLETARLVLTGIRVDARSETPTFYTFLVLREPDDKGKAERESETQSPVLPLVADGQAIFFTHLSGAGDALRAAGIEADLPPLSPEGMHLVDIATALYLLQSEGSDKNAAILNTLSLFADILTTLGIPLPAPFADTLTALGEYLNGNPYFGDFVQQKNVTRQKCLDSVRWCLGTIFSVGRFVMPPDRPQTDGIIPLYERR